LEDYSVLQAITQGASDDLAALFAQLSDGQWAWEHTASFAPWVRHLLGRSQRLTEFEVVLAHGDGQRVQTLPGVSLRCYPAFRQRLKVRIIRKGIGRSGRLRQYRWAVERMLAWLVTHCRLTIRYECQADIHQAFLHLGRALICPNYL